MLALSIAIALDDVPTLTEPNLDHDKAVHLALNKVPSVVIVQAVKSDHPRRFVAAAHTI